jgi:peptide/nickel transport system substrate-binding protein/oligopeptide transport system substrate-binding protein
LAVLTSTLGTHTALAGNNAAGPVHGGTMRIAYTGGVTTFDPAHSYNDDWWLINGTLFNGLYQFDRHGQPQLDLAAGPPTISADHKTWTFHIRKGVRFSNGMPVTADDLRFSITRSLDPHLKPGPSWGQAADEIYQGSVDFANGKAKSVSGIQVLDPYTIRFVLTNPVAAFPYILAETFNMVVPKAVVTGESEQYFASHPVGTGPFKLVSWQKGVGLVLVRNPYYYHPGRPYLDKITVAVPVDSSLITLRIQRGELDAFGNDQDIQAADMQQLRSNPADAKYLFNAPETANTWLDLSPRDAPMDNPMMRQAVAMAINRSRLVKLLGGLGAQAGGMFIPIMTAHDSALDQNPVFPYDPAKAAALVKASGYKGQQITLYYSNNLPDNVSSVPGVLQALQQIGLNVVLRGLTSSSQIALSGNMTGHQIVLQEWSIDYPDAYDIYTGVMSCAANSLGGVSSAKYCDQTADNLVTRAEALPLGADRDALMRQAEMRILKSATKVPLYYIKDYEIASPRIGGFYYMPTFGMQFENYWIKP